MGAFDSVGHSLRNFANFNGRASRSEFWIFFLFVLAVQMVAPMLLGWRIGGLISLLLFVPQLSVAVRRLHDVDCSGKELGAPFLMLFAAGFVFKFPGFLPQIVAFGVLVYGADLLRRAAAALGEDRVARSRTATARARRLSPSRADAGSFGLLLPLDIG
jgi:uncharacterized membrane protein YhaH (DUF805 family)